MRPQHSIRGFNLTELAIVLAIVGVVIGGIWVVASTVIENNRARRVAEQTLTVVQAFKSVYAGRRVDVADDTDITEFAINAKVFPEDMIQNTTTSAYTPWQTTVQAFANRTNNGVRLEFYNLQQKNCSALGTQLLSSTRGGLIIGAINSTSRSFAPVGTADPFTVSEISTACNASSSTLKVTYSMN
ncbi:MAG: prepilin-type N-terminal cleavage/methylation domain-containing protein [Alphaproteobacteria bacterium]|nr:prepilin-type N-terminal cleavage/methylation domain-containing protein [Alphaproteobacteria bacterium]